MSPSIEQHDPRSFGYSKLAPSSYFTDLGVAEQVADLLCRHGPYDKLSDSTSVWMRRHGRSRSTTMTPWFLRIAQVLTEENREDDESYCFYERYLRSRYAQRQIARLQEGRSFPFFADLVSDLSDKPSAAKTWRDVGTALISASPNGQVLPLLRRHILPAFFRHNPKGEVAVVEYHPDAVTPESTMRALYTLSLFPLDEVRQVAEFPALREWQQPDCTEFCQRVFTLLGLLAYPKISHVCTGPFGLSLVFIPQECFEHELPCFPTSWLHYLSGGTSFGEERLDTGAALADETSGEHQRLAHRRHLTTFEPSPDEVSELLPWAIEKLNDLLLDILDFTTFEREQELPGGAKSLAIDGVWAYEHYLTLDRASRLTLALQTVNDAFDAKSGCFEVADVWDAIAVSWSKSSGGTSRFKSLFRPDMGMQELQNALRALPSLWADELTREAECVFRNLESTLLDSVWLPGKRTANGVLVKSQDLSSERLQSPAEFIANTLRALRNTHHGYLTVGDRPKRPARYLAISRGNISDSTPYLSVLWLLAYLADPESFSGLARKGTGFPDLV